MNRPLTTIALALLVSVTVAGCTSDPVEVDTDPAIDGPDCAVWFLDEDGDGYGGDDFEEGCDAPSAAHVLEGGDCDDADLTRNPGADELCDGIDNDCDGELDRDDPSVVDTLDTDGDQLTDCVERDIGTSVLLADTDGDGFSDFVEVVENGFSPTNDNYKFNPRIADTPRIHVEVNQVPTIGLDFAESTSLGMSHEIVRESGTTAVQTLANSSSNSRSVEHTTTIGGSVTVGTEVSFPGGASVSGEATVSYEDSTSTSRSTSTTFTQEQSFQNSSGLAIAEAAASDSTTTIDSGYIRVFVDIVNEGDVAYTLSDLAISASMITPGLESKNIPLGMFSTDAGSAAFDAFTFGVGERRSGFIFSIDDLGPDEARTLLADASNLNLEVVAYNLVDDENRSFTHNTTEISARTATLIVDYDREPGVDTVSTERFQVATNTDPDTLRISLADAMSDTLRMPYVVDADGSLDSVRDVADSPSTNGSWTVLHRTTNSVGVAIVSTYSTATGAYDFEGLELKSGDLVHLVYVEDVDHDGIGTRLEAAYGSDPTNPDTDGDGISDGEEADVYLTSPTLADTDGDGLDDSEELFDWGTDPLWHDTDGDGVRDGVDHFSFIDIDGGDTVSVVTASGELWRWGVTDGVGRPVEGTDWTEVYTGFDFFFGRTETGEYLGQGSTGSGLMGPQASPYLDDLTPILPGADFASLSINGNSAVAIGTDGTLWTWNLFNPTPTQIGTDTDWATGKTANSSFWAIKTDGTMWAWGDNTYSYFEPTFAPLALGFQGGPDPDACDIGILEACYWVDAPIQMNSDTWLSVDASEYHALAVRTDGTLWAWGSGSFVDADQDAAQPGSAITALGFGPGYQSEAEPRQVGTDTDWVQASARSNLSFSHSLALKSDGTLWAWGDGAHGVLGLGDRTVDAATPVQVGTDTDWTQVEAGNGLGMALKTDGSLHTWGEGENLGHPASNPTCDCSESPEPVVLLD